MAVINSLVLYSSLLSVMTYGSYKMNYSKYDTKTVNVGHNGLEKILKSLRGMTGRSLLEFYDKERANPIKFPELLIDKREGMAELLKTNNDDNDIGVYDATSNINKGSDKKRRVDGPAISDNPITSFSPRSFRNKYSPRMYRRKQVTPLHVSRSSTDGRVLPTSLNDRISLLFKKERIMPTSTDGRVSPTFSEKRDSPSSSDDALTKSTTRKREHTTLRKNSWTFGTVLYKHIHQTNHPLLVFDKKGNMISNVTIHRAFRKLK